ncbi:HypC/HybG/HupF family hydrogenase formation chaperone [Actinocrinis puniceicyclus]|uniref:HypC/HybG/HupF family hydrogenase formation chaperone n=1 Tax=Actinocrinis puniceicyclus TaxID=977794 RepID=A0A8J7WIF9_9ACTN|nr:HypC/HybG/HupF family hydrogenase formation chaperone [Actinocrinis puniceicyclus]MBS2961520.1 HypC/HybG/HupF family hydrogenase formation chaperone [Actinocrinis puniceicyclus]
MCLSVPGRIVEVRQAEPFAVAMVECDDGVKQVSLAMVPDAAVGEYVIVHVGFAVDRMAEAEALAALELLRSL